MAEEKNLWKQLKNNTKSIIWTRIESSTGLGIPDLFGYWKRGFWLELKIITIINLTSQHIKLRGFIGIILLAVLYSYLPKTLFRRGSNYSQGPLSVIPSPLAISLHYVPLTGVPGPRAGISCCTYWVAGLLMVDPVRSSISLHSDGHNPLPLIKKAVQPVPGCDG